MAKVADNVQSWKFKLSTPLRLVPVWTDDKVDDKVDGDQVVPAFVCARRTTDGHVVRPRVDAGYGMI